jgi:hypothetical protein
MTPDLIDKAIVGLGLDLSPRRLPIGREAWPNAVGGDCADAKVPVSVRAAATTREDFPNVICT